jgi:membrane protein YqaA with SNARE-associated domain
MNKKNLRLIVEITATLFAIAITALLIITFLNLEYIKESSSNLIYSYGLPALFLVSALLEIVPQYLSPIVTSGVAIIAGLSPLYVIPTAILGSMLGSTIGYILGKKYMKKAIDIMASKESIEKLEELTNKYGKAVVALAAISPLPYLPLGIGALNFSTKNFVIYALIPRALSFIVYGLFFNLF